MTTSDDHRAHDSLPGRVPLRLRMAADPGAHRLDGAWWPQSRDLPVELADLVEHFPASSGRVARALVSPPDWDSHPRLVAVQGRHLKVGSFPRDDTHLIILTTGDRVVLHVLVVPPGFAPAHAAEAFAAASAGTTRTATELLGHVARPSGS